MTLRNGLDESGAAAIMTIVFSVAVVGAMALSIDVGAVLLLKRRMVTAADTAALAAAQRCALDLTDQHTSAVATATQNVADAASIGAITCNRSSRSVRVEFHAARDLSFAPVLGFKRSEVTRTATAIWGPARRAHVPVPLILGANSSPCVSTTRPAAGTACRMWFVSGVAGSSGNWGFIDFSSWDDSSKCSGQTSTDEITDNTKDYELGANGSTVCRSPGNPPRLWNALASQIGNTRAFPVTSGTTTASSRVFTVSAFVPLRIDAVWDGRFNSVQATAACGPLPPGSNTNSATCLVASWQGAETTPGPIGSGPDLGLASIRLSD